MPRARAGDLWAQGVAHDLLSYLLVHQDFAHSFGLPIRDRRRDGSEADCHPQGLQRRWFHGAVLFGAEKEAKLGTASGRLFGLSAVVQDSGSGLLRLVRHEAKSMVPFNKDERAPRPKLWLETIRHAFP